MFLGCSKVVYFPQISISTKFHEARTHLTVLTGFFCTKEACYTPWYGIILSAVSVLLLRPVPRLIHQRGGFIPSLANADITESIFQTRDVRPQAYAGASGTALVVRSHFSSCNVSVRGPPTCTIVVDSLKSTFGVSQLKLGF